MNATQQRIADEIVEDFELFDEWEDRYRFLIDLGRKVPPLGADQHTEENRVRGCQSNVWLVARPRREDGHEVIDFLADSDSVLVKGLIAILHKVYSGQPAEDIVSFDVEQLFNRLELGQHLSMSRRNGLSAMVQRIKALAAANQATLSGAAKS